MADSIQEPADAPRALRPNPYIAPSSYNSSAIPPGSELAGLINLSNNESRFGSSPRAHQAARDELERLNLYADGSAAELRSAIAQRHGLDPARLVFGNGSEELIDAAARVYTRAGDEVIYLQYGFPLFRIVAARTGATGVEAPVGPGFEIDIDAILAAVSPATRLVFLANPENPTGRHVSAGEVARLLAALRPDIVLVLDCAYAEFVDDAGYSSGLELVDRYPNLFVTRSFSKCHGLAGCRLGWGYGAPELVSSIRQACGISNTNRIALAAARGAMEDYAFMEAVVTSSNRERQRISSALEGLGLAPVPSGTNFVLFGCAAEGPLSAPAILARVHAAGLRLRAQNDPGLETYLRMTVGLPKDNDRVLAAISSA